jgi:hypothetical protein
MTAMTAITAMTAMTAMILIALSFNIIDFIRVQCQGRTSLRHVESISFLCGHPRIHRDRRSSEQANPCTNAIQ